jgi:hypothetical protein
LLLSNNISFSDLSYEENQLQSSWGGVFYHPVFLKTAAEIQNLKRSAFYINVGDMAVGAVNILYQMRNLVNAATIPHLFQYYGILFFSQDYEKVLIKDIIGKLENESDYLYICFSPEFNGIDVLSKNWNLVNCVTLGLDADDLQNWGCEFKHSVRKQVKKAERENIIINVKESVPVELWEKSYSRSNTPTPIKSEQLKTWTEKLIENSLLKIYTAEIDNITIAFRGQLVYGDYAYDWIAGSDPEYNITGANQLLMSAIGDDFRNRGIKMWDLVDARIESIARFKRSFGAKDYYHWQAFRGIGLKGRLFNMMRKYKNE